MARVVGIYLKNEYLTDINAIRCRMTKVVNHENHKTTEIVFPRFECCLMDYGLSDPNPAPLFNEDRSICAFLDGEIVDVVKLRDDLVKRGHCFAGDSDAEVVLHLYEEKGEQFARNLNGSFNAIFYHPERNKLVLCSDRFGLRRLYYCDRGNYVIFGPEIKALLEDVTLSPELNYTAVAEFLHFGYCLDNKTLLEQIELLPPGTLATWDNGKHRLDSYWNWGKIPLMTSEQVPHEHALVDTMGAFWVQAVKRRCEKPGRIGVYLSGGLDSRAVVSAIEEKYFPIHVINFGAPGSDDTVISRKVAQRLNLTYHHYDLSGEKWFEGLGQAMWLTEGAISLTHLHALPALKYAKDLFDVHMSGFAGDLIAGGSYLPSPHLTLKTSDDVKGFIYDKMNAGNVLDGTEKECFGENFYTRIRDLHQQSFTESFNRIPAETKNMDYFFLHNRVRRFTATGLAVQQTILETRLPFYDIDFIEFMYGLPTQLRMGSHIYKKMLLKFFPLSYRGIPWQKSGHPIDAGRLRVTGAKLHRKLRRMAGWTSARIGSPGLYAATKSFADYSNWFRRSHVLRSFLYSTLLSQRALARDFFRPEFIKKVLDTHMSGEANNLNVIGLLLTLELFCRSFIERERPDSR
ncbi:MAG: hypothetical protein C4532_08160 [Candidatus Abyssobacteria bacterium SURF_17]|jgi:asparagine synthase (glutamine-hydrolysing)|uniref:asparagine synthase (glutamine-hydrolyzing) n=1 Tax=Candidatus Abyssobacteria bacterium SURF_17 TaxID=2093361 RepID=A0A419EZW9_9BACT|nr:MAG: hypothetical protein C4532_08160 [Candidatus Abyssubacteria bacterium SURF_17]